MNAVEHLSRSCLGHFLFVLKSMDIHTLEHISTYQHLGKYRLELPEASKRGGWAGLVLDFSGESLWTCSHPQSGGPGEVRFGGEHGLRG